MTEWRNTEVAAYDKGNQYDKLPNDRIQQLAGCLDTVLDNYIRGAGDKSFLNGGTNTNGEKYEEMMIGYSDVMFNDFQGGVITRTEFTLVRTDNMIGPVKEAYDIAIKRHVVVDRISKQSDEVIANDLKTRRHDSFTEYYCFEKFPNDIYHAYVGRLNEVRRDGEIDYNEMSLYDVQYLTEELDKIVGLYDASRRDRVTIE